MNIIEKAKALWSIWAELNKIKEAKMKSGIMTTEFWLVVLGGISTVAIALWGIINPQWIVVATLWLPTVYTIARTIVKATASKDDDAVFNSVLDKLKPILDKLNIPVEHL